MGAEPRKPSDPDLSQGVPFGHLPDGSMFGHVGDEAVLLARRDDEVFAIGAMCTHYGAPLDGGLLVDDTLRCHWHHACFSLRTGEALRAPALNPLAAGASNSGTAPSTFARSSPTPRDHRSRRHQACRARL